ncbi:M56 family metallopeptidase [Ekhidna sp.]
MQRIYLISSIFLSLILPTVPLEWNAAIGSPEINDLTRSVQALTIPTTASAQTDSQWSLLASIYLTGVLFMCIRFAIRLNVILSIVRKTPKEQHEDYIRVYTEESIPISSFFKFIFIPKSTSKESLKYMLLHEKKHVNGLHSIDLIIVQLIYIFFWFNPILLLYNKSIKTIHEFICDEAVVSRTSVSSYQKILIQSLFSNAGLSLTSPFNQISAKNRIIMMNKEKTKGIKKAKLLFVIPVLAMLILACNPESLQNTTPVEISGHVVNGEGKALPGVSVIVEGKDLGVVTNLKGEYRIGGLDSDNDKLTYSMIGFEPVSVSVKKRSIIDIELAKNGNALLDNKVNSSQERDIQYAILNNDGKTFKGIITEKSGNPMKGAYVVILGGEKSEKAISDDEGKFEIPTSQIAKRFVVYRKETNEAFTLDASSPSTKTGE